MASLAINCFALRIFWRLAGKSRRDMKCADIFHCRRVDPLDPFDSIERDVQLRDERLSLHQFEKMLDTLPHVPLIYRQTGICVLKNSRPGEGDHAVHEVGFDEFLPDLALAGLVGGSRRRGTVGGDAVGSEIAAEGVRFRHRGRDEVHSGTNIAGGVFGSGLGFGGAGHERLSGNFRVDGCYQSAWRKFWQGFQP